MTQNLVSVVVITYCQKDYIKTAIYSILNQKCDFDFELIIADDCSPDNTESIIKNIINTHPKGNLIRYFKHKENIGIQKNGIFAFNQSKSKYIAICEGDDFWTDPYKLQKQVNIIEHNDNCNIVYHNCLKVDENGKSIGLVYEQNYNKNLKITDMLLGDYTKTCTMLFRNYINVALPDELDDTILGQNQTRSHQ